MKEYILCSAIYYNDGKEYPHQPNGITSGIVVCGRRHHNCITTISRLHNPTRDDKLRIKIAQLTARDAQGFLTNTNRFVGRKEAAKIAIAAEQLLYPKLFNPDNSIGLISEDVW